MRPPKTDIRFLFYTPKKTFFPKEKVPLFFIYNANKVKKKKD